MTDRGASSPARLVRKVAATVVVLGSVACFDLFVTQATFDVDHDPITSSVLARP